MAAALSALAMAPSPLFSQTDPQPAGTYAFTLRVPVIQCGFEGGPVDQPTEAYAPAGARFFFVQSVPRDTVVIQFLTYRNNPELKRRFNEEEENAQKYFCLPRKRFDQYSRRSYDTGPRSGDIAVGALAIPVKLRPGVNGAGFDFANNVSFGTSVGWRWRQFDKREVYFAPIVGLALSSVDLTSENTGGTITEKTSRSAITWATGLMVEVNKVQLGMFVGQDRIAQPEQAKWAFQGKTWFGVGLGVALFGAAPEKVSSGTQK